MGINVHGALGNEQMGTPSRLGLHDQGSYAPMVKLCVEMVYYYSESAWIKERLVGGLTGVTCELTAVGTARSG